MKSSSPGGEPICDSYTRSAIVVDCGTGFTKIGFSGNQEVTFCTLDQY